jgi:hypothetical protein
MQPTPTISQDIKTLADWTYQQFKPTDPIEVQNILDKPYYFKYCVGETVETPDQVSRKVVDRQYEEITFEPGETKILMGAAAYVFLGGIAPAYVLQTKSQEAMGDLAELIAAADLAIIGKVGYARHAEGTTPVTNKLATPVSEPTAPANHNPNAVADNDGNMPPQTAATGQETPPADDGNEDDDAFANMGNDNPPATEFQIGDDQYKVTTNGRGMKNGQFISNEALAEAQAQYAASQA